MNLRTLGSALLLLALCALCATGPASANHQHWNNDNVTGRQAGAQPVVNAFQWTVCVYSYDPDVLATVDQAISNWEISMGWVMFYRSCSAPDITVKYLNIDRAGYACSVTDVLDDWSNVPFLDPGDTNCDGILIDTNPDYSRNLRVTTHELGHMIGLGDHYHHDPPGDGSCSSYDAVMDCESTIRPHDTADLVQGHTPLPLDFFKVRPDSYWVRAHLSCPIGGYYDPPNETSFGLWKNSTAMSGSWSSISQTIGVNACSYMNTGSMGYPPTGGEHCYRARPKSVVLGLDGPYSSASCVARNPTGPLVTFIHNRLSFGFSQYFAQNHSFGAIPQISFYKGLWWSGGAMILPSCTNVPPTGTCEVGSFNLPGGPDSILIVGTDGVWYGDTITRN